MAANAFGALGYMSAIFQWAWALLLIGYPLLANPPEFLLPQAHNTTPIVPAEPTISTPFVTGIAIIATLLVLAATVVVIIRLPRTIGRQAASITKAATNAAIPVLTHRKKITKKQRKKLSYRLSLWLKTALILLPLALLFFAHNSAIPLAAAWVVGLFCATFTTLYFGVQQLIAALGKIDRDLLW